ncbi:MAG TPA: efflux RND transporter periplasmic adaptor subunit [Bacteroidales bacterium]|nr:efflux RND transporter periplasmic adaptor subunit [Bacteroidales bacterium]
MRTRIIIIIVIAAFFSGVAFKLNDVKREKNEEIEMIRQSGSVIPVTVVTAQLHNTETGISYNGTFESNYEVTVVSEAQGIVKELNTEEGMFVPEGKVVACLENDITSYQLQTAEAAFRKSEADLKRFENLSPGEAVTAQQMDEIRLAEINARNSWLMLKKQYENTFIKAPVSGIISKRYIHKGSFIAAGSPVLDIIDNSEMKFCAWFCASDIVRIKAGQGVKIKTELYPNVSYDGTIKILSIKPDESKRYRIQALVHNSKNYPILPGTDGTLSFSLKHEQKRIAIPHNCIVGNLNEPKVYIVESGEARLHPVEIEEIINGRAIISGGLNEGDQVVKSGQINLQDNAKVNVISSETL